MLPKLTPYAEMLLKMKRRREIAALTGVNIPTKRQSRAHKIRPKTPEWAKMGRFQTIAVDLARPWRERPE